MRIAIFTNNYLPNPYGVTQSIESFRRQFEKRGHTVYVFAPSWKGYYDENKNVFRYSSVDIEFKFRFPLAIPFSRKMDKIISGLKLDIIHSQHPNLLGSSASKWARKKNIPLVFTWHTLYDQYVHFAPLVPKKWAAKWIIKKAVRYANSADYVITPTDSVQEIIKKWGANNKKITSIPSGVDEQNFTNPDRKIIRNEYGINDDETLLFSVCRLTQEKNVKFLFKAIIQVLKANQKCKFMVVSSGDLENDLKKTVEKNNLTEKVIFAGIVMRDKIKDYFAAGDIFVYASKSETQGMIVSEAMYMGLPVVAVDATGICDLVENNVNGFLVSENETEFAEAVMKLIDDKELRKIFGENSARIAREKYTDEVCAKRMLEVYNSLIINK